LPFRSSRVTRISVIALVVAMSLAFTCNVPADPVDGERRTDLSTGSPSQNGTVQANA
jgi:hypothetical protein